MPYKATEKQRSYQAHWMWRRRMVWILEHGPCSQCGSSQDLRVVYKDPKEKTVKVAAIWSRKDEDRAQLLARCIVLCTVCALSKRHEERQPEHGTPGRYDQGCRCDQCRPAKSQKRKAERARKKEREAALQS